MLTLKDFAKYSSDKINNNDLNKNNYIGVDNLLQNKEGIKPSNYVPTSGISTKFTVGDILIGNIRPYFKKIWLASFEGGCSADVLCLRPKNSDMSNYLFAILSQDNFFDYSMAGSKGSKMPRGDKKHIMNFPITVTKNYKKVGELIINLNKQIERNNAMVHKLQVMGQGIFNKFFSNENTFISLLKFPYIRIIKPGIDKFKNNKKYVATAEVDKDKMNLDSPIINFETRENRANMQPVKNSVWFAKLKNSIKHIFVSENDNLLINNYIFSTGFCGLQCENFVFEYMINYVNNKYFEKRKDDLSHGATMEGINNDNLNSFIIALPKKEKLELFHNKTKKIYLQISKIINFNYRLSNLKNKLLPLLINGQIEIN